MAKQKKVLVLRTCSYRMTSRNGFKWPKEGPVKAPEWDPAIVCGKGLHGLLWGEGDGYLLSESSNAKWLVVEVLEVEPNVLYQCSSGVLVKAEQQEV